MEYPIATANSEPFGIAAGADGALWFTEAGGNKVGRITTAGRISEYAVPTPSSEPRGIVAGSDGALWFTEWQGDRIGRIKP
jgi:virginiamycin B lyase